MIETTLNIMGMQVPIKASPEDILGLANRAGIQIQPFAQAANSLAATLNRWFPAQGATAAIAEPEATPTTPTTPAAPVEPPLPPIPERFVRDHTGVLVSLEDLEKAFAIKAAANAPKTCDQCLRSNAVTRLPDPIMCGKCYTDLTRPGFIQRPPTEPPIIPAKI